MDCVKLSGLKENDMLTWLTVLPLMPIAVLFGRYLMTKIRPSYSLCKLCHWLLKNQELYKNLTNDLSGPMSLIQGPMQNCSLRTVGAHVIYMQDMSIPQFVVALDISVP